MENIWNEFDGLCCKLHCTPALGTREPDEGARAHRMSRTCLGRSLSSSSAAVDRQDDVPGLLLRFDVPGRLDHVLHRVAPIDDRPLSPGLVELLEQENVLLLLSTWHPYHPF